MKLKTIVTDPRLSEFGLPQRATVGSAGLDLRAMKFRVLGSPGWLETSNAKVMPGKQVQVNTGLRVWIEDPAYVGLVFARSGLGTKGLVLGNGTGVIDADYQGDLILTLWNRSTAPIQINRGDRVAQMVVLGVAPAEIEVVDDFEAATDRGDGGHGSTGAQ